MIERFRDHLHAIIDISRELQDLTSDSNQFTLLETIEDNAHDLLEKGLRWLEELMAEFDTVAAAVDTMNDEFRSPVMSIRSYTKVMLLGDVSAQERMLLEEMKTRADEIWEWTAHQ
ncbi:MAG: hypothetical protein L0154_21210 [Chloroflexi bacterium]|nr:hypothetical protein [Chloroflexota bacterium]